jgi:hypothetical protein
MFERMITMQSELCRSWWPAAGDRARGIALDVDDLAVLDVDELAAANGTRGQIDWTAQQRPRGSPSRTWRTTGQDSRSFVKATEPCLPTTVWPETPQLHTTPPAY